MERDDTLIRIGRWLLPTIILIAIATVVWNFGLPTGFATFGGSEEITQTVSLVFTEDSEYLWTLANAPEHFSLSSVKIDGKILGTGEVKAVLVTEQGSFKILDTSSESRLSITGFVTAEERLQQDLSVDVDDETLVLTSPIELLDNETLTNENSSNIITENTTTNITIELDETNTTATTTPEDTPSEDSTPQDTEPEISFTGECQSTCQLPENIGNTSYTIKIYIEQGTTFELNSITYSMTSEDVETFEPKPKIKDSKGRVLKADIKFKDTHNQKEVKGKLPKGKYDIDIDLRDENIPVKKIYIEQAEVSSNLEEFIRVEDINESGDYAQWAEVYAIDPTATNFSSAIVTVIATGDTLHKCKDYNFDTQECFGDWELFKTNLTPSEVYTFILTPEDPVFAESISTCAAEIASAKGSFGSACSGTYPAACGPTGDFLSCNDANVETHNANGKGGYAGVRTTQFNSSITDCTAITSVLVCYEWYLAGGFSPTDCDVSIDNQGGTNFTATTTTCPGTTADPGITCINVTQNKSWTCSNFFGSSGTRAQVKSELTRNTGGAKTSTWDLLAYNVTYTSAVFNTTDPNDQVHNIGNYTTIVWNLTGAGGHYYIQRNGTTVEDPLEWLGPEQLVTYVPNTYFLGDWNYTLFFNQTNGETGNSSVLITVVDQQNTSCTEASQESESVVGPTLTSPTIDGDLSDWDSILANGYNYVADLLDGYGDPDDISTSDRDMLTFAYTYDDNNLYFYFKRSIKGNRQVSMLVYLDYDLDGYMNATDQVVKFVWSGSNRLYNTNLYDYIPASPPGDLMQGDGFDMPGTITINKAIVSGVLGGSIYGTELETTISWSDLGFQGPVDFKASSALGSGTNLPSQLEDNVGDILTSSISSVYMLPSSDSASTTNGTSIYYVYEVISCGGSDSFIDIVLNSSEDWNVTVFYPWSNETAITDSDSDGYPDTTVPVGTSIKLIIKIDVPSDATLGTTDTTNITIMTDNQNVTSQALTTVADIALAPLEYQIFGAPDMVVSSNFTVSNYQTFEDTIEVESNNTNSWTTIIYYANGTTASDTDSDGHADLGLFGISETKDIIVKTIIPPGATIGSSEVTTITINSSNTTTKYLSAITNITVRNRMVLTPSSYNRTVSSLTRQYFLFNLTNNWNSSDTFDLSYTSTQGWNTTFVNSQYLPLTDTDSDGVVDTGLLEPFGGLFTFYVKILVPQNTTMGVSEITTIYANSSLDSTFHTATINETPRGISFYNDSARNNIDYIYDLDETVYATSFYLTGISKVYFVWYDGLLPRRTSNNISVSAQGTANDSLTTNTDYDSGTWTVIVYDASDDSEVTRNTFTLVDPLAPNLTAWKPSLGDTFYTGTTIEIAANSTDNVLTYLVQANISYPDGNWSLIELYNYPDISWNTSFQIPDNATGRFNITFFGYDTYGNVNDTETTYFIVEDAYPQIEFVPPTTGSGTYNQDYILANVTATDSNLDNITIWLYNDTGLINQYSTTTSPAFFNFTGLPFATYYLNATAKDSFNQLNWTETRTITLIDSAPSVLGFSLTLPGQAPVNASSDGNATGIMLFNSTLNTVSNMDPCVQETDGCQNSTLPFFTYYNTGNLNLTVNISLDSALPSVLLLKVNTIYNGAGATEVNTTSQTLFTDLVPGTDFDAYFFGDFINAHPTDSTTRELYSNGTQSG